MGGGGGWKHKQTQTITHDLIYEMVYLFAKLLKQLIHRLGGPQYVVLRISGCSDMFVII